MWLKKLGKLVKIQILAIAAKLALRILICYKMYMYILEDSTPENFYSGEAVYLKGAGFMLRST